ncbi:hypothetical protein CVT26_004059 [Gymnopilus dilepis]|uniref:Uncharacterized protein n=1 Tax=Gymnopilus dilepis TaxID=231916 RepID=A0A409YMG7_9AGAR|nr:hypothetical protein CVT26_004059 [Gymnopilus dilepis]
MALKNKRSATGHHLLLPSSRSGSTLDLASQPPPAASLLTWTFGRGSVIWRIWPAVLLHTLFAVVVVTMSLQDIIHLEIPSVMLTVLGVVIGFVISYRASSGYDRYWMGRSYWGDVIRNTRTLGRLIWFHVPPRVSPKTAEEIQSGTLQRSEEEMNKVMAEKRMALDLLEGFSPTALHFLGELGIYYQDLYHLVRPMHEHDHTADEDVHPHATSSGVSAPRKAQRITKQTIVSEAPRPSSPPQPPPRVSNLDEADPIIPPINAYGTFDPAKVTKSSSRASTGSRATHHLLGHSTSRSSSRSSVDQHVPLMPSAQPPEEDGVLNKVSGELIPFAGLIASIRSWFAAPPLEVLPPGVKEIEIHARHLERKAEGLYHPAIHLKHRPKIAGGGENLPVQILRCLSEWFSVLEDRGTVPGTSMGPLIGTIAAFEDSLSGLERILTTPLPFVYAVHISTVWIYLFFLPFQLVTQFQYYTIPGVAIAAFIYLGFLAAGEEIEQPFGKPPWLLAPFLRKPDDLTHVPGYDENDLDLDLFCHSIIHNELKQLRNTPCLNVYFGPESDQLQNRHHRTKTLAEIVTEQIELRENEGLATGLNHEWS